jgi:cbb3-type cytochrome oxidase subunit 3
VSALLVSDREREYTVGLLRGHWLAGRLTAEEFEERVEEAWRARFATDLWRALRALPVEEPPVWQAPRRSRSGTASLVLGISAICLLFFSFGLLFFLTLPLAITAWALGREARRAAPPGARGPAVAGEALGIAGTLLSLVPFVALAGLFGLLL